MKVNFQIKQWIFVITLLALFTMPATISAQSIWDMFSSGFWYAIGTSNDDPNDDKKKKPGQPQPQEPSPQADPHQCFDGVIPIPCPSPVDNKLQ